MSQKLNVIRYLPMSITNKTKRAMNMSFQPTLIRVLMACVSPCGALLNWTHCIWVCDTNFSQTVIRVSGNFATSEWARWWYKPQWVLITTILLSSTPSLIRTVNRFLRTCKIRPKRRGFNKTSAPYIQTWSSLRTPICRTLCNFNNALFGNKLLLNVSMFTIFPLYVNYCFWRLDWQDSDSK